MKRDKLRIGVITAALAMMIAGGVLTWQQDARNGKADQAKQGETAQLTEDESTGTTEQQTEETTGDADGTRAVQDQADDVENSLEQAPEMEAACEEEAVGNPEADAETAQNTPEDQEKQRRMKKRVQHPELWILQKIRKRQLRQQGLHRI